MSRIIPILLSVFGFRAVSGTAAAWRTKCGAKWGHKWSDESGDEWDTRRGTRRGAGTPWPMAAGGSIRAAGGYGGRSFRRNRRCDRSRDRTGGNAASSARLLPPPIASGYCSPQLNMYSAQLVVGAGGGDRHALDRSQSLRVRTRRLVRGLYLRTLGAVRASTGHGVSPARMPRESNQEGERRKNELDDTARRRLTHPTRSRLRPFPRERESLARERPDRLGMPGSCSASPTARSARPGESAARPTRWARSTTQDAGI